MYYSQKGARRNCLFNAQIVVVFTLLVWSVAVASVAVFEMYGRTVTRKTSCETTLVHLSTAG